MMRVLEKMRLSYEHKIVFFATVFIVQSCSTRNNLVSTKEYASYVQINPHDNRTEAKVTLFHNGEFIYCETDFDILGNICHLTKGRWHQKGNIVYLTSFFQNTIKDYIVEHGSDAPKDSVWVYVHSRNTNKATDDFAFVSNNNELVFPNSEGCLCVPCTEKENLAKQLLQGVFDGNDSIVHLECGREYLYYIKDCLPIIFNEEGFLVTDSGWINIETKVKYIRLLQ